MPRPLILLPDWIFGSDGKRLVLSCVLTAGDGTVWTEPQVCAAVNKDRHSSLRTHLEALTQMGLMRRHMTHPISYELIPATELDDARRRIRDALSALLPPLEALPNDRVPPPKAS